MPRTPLVVVGASAGGVEALQQLLPTLGRDLPAAVAIALHRLPAEDGDRLPGILGKHANLPVGSVRDGEPIRPGRAYVAPAGLHLEIEDDVFLLSAGPRENFSRPSIDVLFRSAAEAHGRKVVGVLLSGLLDDGSAGLAAIKAAGGYTIVQEPADALFGDMPRNAIANVQIDRVVPVERMAEAIVAALEEIAIPLGRRREPRVNEPSQFSCPDCGGVLWKLEEDGVLHYRCRTGHAYSPSGLFAQQDEALEAGLWTAVRALEERAEMSELLAKRLENRGLRPAAQRLEERARVARERADVVRKTVTDLVDRREAVEANELSTGA
ncbi:MAG: chemotaxis protein CheB [Candidatus Eremiobacteraeota bacterium]|nr:chemotaxis protein CheB [Candidatus Eremiobacteraeota bacterium]